MNPLARLDLNLLVLFEALLAERNITRAAGRVGLAQPSASRALDRLRDIFDDQLFVRTPAGMTPTARAIALAPEITTLLELARGLVADQLPFNPADASGTVRIAIADVTALSLLPLLAERVCPMAPKLRLSVHPLDKDRAFDDLDAGRIDAVVGVFPDVPERLRTAQLYEERFVCIARADHPRLAAGLDLDAYCDVPHLLFTLRDDARGVVDAELARLGRSRDIAVRVCHALAVPEMVSRCDLVATIPSRFAQRMPAACRVHKPPLGLDSWTETLIWSQRTDRDPLSRWFRERLREAAKAV